MLDALTDADHAAFEAAQALHWQPLTAIFLLASAWWFKGLTFTFAAAWFDARLARRLPMTALAVCAAGLAADAAAVTLKHVFERERPVYALAGFDPVGTTPDSPAFPSGHASSAFAAAVALAALYPRLRVPAIALAALVALSRVYLGVHFPADVVAGALLGTSVGLAFAAVLRAAGPTLADRRLGAPHAP